MRDKIQKAIDNNNELYKAIFANREIAFNRTNSICYSLEKTPPLYSNIVTISENWKPDEIFSSVDLNYEIENWSEWSIKDSFNRLDLFKYKFTKLFEARWMYLETAKFDISGQKENLRYEIVNNEEALSAWKVAWDSNEQLGGKIFKRELLNNPKVYFVAGYREKQIISGCFINESSDVLGISNFFAPDKRIEYWTGMIDFILTSIKKADIVGYERPDLLNKLRPLGFEATGNLTVWLKKREIKCFNSTGKKPE